MFSHLFNTYEAVTPPPKSKQDFKQEIYQEPDQDTLIIDPLGLGPISRVPYVDKPSDQPFVLKLQSNSISEEVPDVTEQSAGIPNYDSENPLLQNQDVQKPTTSKISFSSKKEFARTLVSGYMRALSANNLDPNYAYILTAQAAIESGWGNKQSGKFNFGGIKAGKNTPGTYKSTTEWSPTKGYYKSVEKFRDFSSIDDYCNYRIQLLSNRRYNVFNQFKASQSYDIVYHMLKKGYGSDRGGPKSRRYARDAQSICNSIINMLS